MQKGKPRGFFARKKTKRQYELLGGVSTAAASLLIISIFLLTSLDKILIRSNEYAAVIAAVLVDMANGDRTMNQLHGLTINPVLVAAAQAKANDMAKLSYFAHVSPEGKDPWYWFKQAGYSFTYAGENLAVDFSDSGDVNTAWMNSPSHRENLLDPHFTEIGIATASGFYQGHPTIFVVQEFGAPSPYAATAALQAATTPKNPTTTAIATTKPTTAPPIQTALKPSVPSIHTEPSVPSKVLGEQSPAPQTASFWSYLLASPKSTLYLAYYLVAAFILLAIAIDTGFQIRMHHERKAIMAGALLALVLVCMIAANVYLFPSPTVSQSGAMTAAVASAL